MIKPFELDSRNGI